MPGIVQSATARPGAIVGLAGGQGRIRVPRNWRRTGSKRSRRLSVWKITDGIRWTGTPAWKVAQRPGHLDAALVLEHMDKLPPQPSAGSRSRNGAESVAAGVAGARCRED